MIIASSKKSQRTTNPIRNIVDNLKPPQNHPKKLLNLALGDPCVHGNLQCPSVLDESIAKTLSAHDSNGYLASVGSEDARKAIAKSSSRPGFEVSADDVVIASGCSGAIDLVLTALMNEGDNVLVPRPCFPLYQVVSESLGGNVQHYNLKAEKSWECDIDSINDLINEKTRAIVINNPSNPCGSNFSAEHLREIAAVARKHNLPIVADEIYGNVVFDGEFFPMHVYSGDVPVISLSGLAKEFVVPGWRVGWLTIHDKGTGRLIEVKKGIKALSQIVLGATSLVQSAIPNMLCPVPDSEAATSLTAFKARYIGILRENAELCKKLLADSPVLTVIEPQGAMYTMVKIDFDQLDKTRVDNDAEFARLLLLEENLFVLPGQCFTVRNFVRLVLCPPPEKMRDACERLMAFTARYVKVDAVEQVAKKQKV